MEIAGLGIGVISLVSTCLDVLDKVDAYKSFGSDSQVMSLCFEADRYRFSQWLQAVGIVNGRLKDDHHPLLDDPALQPLLYNILSCVCSIWGVGSATLDALDAANLDRADTLLSCDAGKPMKAQKMLNAAQSRLGAKKVKIGWALGGKSKLMAQLEAFDALVDRLYRLVPPTGTSIAPPSASAPPDIRTNQLKDSASAEQRRLMSEMRDLVKRETQHAFTKWLGAATLTNHYFEKCLSTRLADTCGWIFATSSFLEWASLHFPSDTAKVLWINGPAGYGKTILCASIIQHLKANITPPSPAPSAPSPSTPPAALAYHFCSSDYESRDDPLAIVRSWISQLVSGNEEALNAALDYIPANEAGTATERELWELLGAIAQAVPLCTLVVDGLDECAASHADALQASYDRFPIVNRRASFLACLKEATARTKTRVLVVSRDEVDIRAHLRPSGGIVGVSNAADSEDERDRHRDGEPDGAAPVTLSEYQITAEDVHSDVGLFARSVVQKQLPKKDAALRESLAAQMADKCDGMFLWIRLQERRLLAGRHNSKRLLDVVQQMPPGLDRLYDRNMADIMRLDGHQQCRALAILRWTTFALRPLTLDEITDALAVVNDDDREDLCVEELPDTVDEDYVEDQIVSICSSLVEVRRDNLHDTTIGSGTLHFVHFSVKQYLLSATLPPELPSVDRIPFANTGVQQGYLARLCLRYLLTADAWDDDRRSPFLSYAAFGWYQHVNLGALDDEQLAALICKFFHPQCRRWDQWQDHRRNHMEAKFGPEKEELALQGPRLYVAALLGLLKAADFLCVQSTAELNDAGGPLGTPLQAAAAGGHLPLIQYLLNRGADINACSGTYGSALNTAVARGHEDAVRYLISHEADLTLTDQKERTALTLAATVGQTQVIKLLLERGADVAVKAENGWTPLNTAAAKGFFGVVELLLERGADHTVVTVNNQTALYAAAANGHTKLVNLLVEHGANLEQACVGGWTPLNAAACRGYVETVRLLLERGADLRTPSDSGYTPLHSAAVYGDEEVVKLLLERGADFKSPNNSGMAPLHSAAANGHVEVVKLLVEYGANLEQADNYGFTPLIRAAAEGYVDIVRYLLERGVNFRAVNNDRFTSLCAAAVKGHVDVVKLFIEHGADFEQTNKDGIAPLHSAAANGHMEVVKLLVVYGANLEQADNYGSTPLIRAAAEGHVEIVRHLLEKGANFEVVNNKGLSSFSAAAAEGHIEVVKLLIENGADIEQKNQDGGTPLIVAVEGGRIEVVKLLLERGASPAVQDDRGVTPLYGAARHGHVEVVELLLEKGANLAVPAMFGQTPLHVAASWGKTEVVKLLLQRGADTAVLNAIGWSPLTLAALNGYPEVARLLLEHSADGAARGSDISTSLFEAASRGHVEVVRLLLEHGADVALQDSKGSEPLILAAVSGHAEVVKLLLEHGANVALRNNQGWTALTLAAVDGHVEVVRRLLEQGADVGLQNTQGWTPMPLAAAGGHVEVVKLLLEHGANVNLQHNTCATPLAVAAKRGHVEVVRLLLKHGADVALRDNESLTPLHLAAADYHTEVVKLLLEHGADVNASASFTGTALHHAFHRRSSASIEDLLGRGASPLIPDGFGRTVSDWARIQGWPDLAGTPLASISDHDCNRATDQRRLRRAVVRLANDTQLQLPTNNLWINYLRRALIYLGDLDSAHDCVTSWSKVYCDSCNTDDLESFHSCTSCFDRDFCDQCVDDSDRSKRGWCMDHALVAFKRTPSNGDGDINSRPTLEELLKRLVAKYSVDEGGEEQELWISQ